MKKIYIKLFFGTKINSHFYFHFFMKFLKYPCTIKQCIKNKSSKFLKLFPIISLAFTIILAHEVAASLWWKHNAIAHCCPPLLPGSVFRDLPTVV